MGNRDVRLQEVLHAIACATDDGISISRKKLIANACIDWGCSRRYIAEMINILIDAGRIELKNKDELWIIK